MAKFCIHCGKPLEDGEVCNCQDNVTTTLIMKLQTQTLATQNLTLIL